MSFMETSVIRCCDSMFCPFYCNLRRIMVVAIEFVFVYLLPEKYKGVVPNSLFGLSFGVCHLRLLGLAYLDDVTVGLVSRVCTLETS